MALYVTVCVLATFEVSICFNSSLKLHISSTVDTGMDGSGCVVMLIRNTPRVYH